MTARAWSLCVLLLALVCTQELVSAKIAVHHGGTHSSLEGAADGVDDVDETLYMDAEKWNQSKWEAFDRLDVVKEGLLSKEEVLEGLSKQFDRVDKAGTGMIDFDQFMGLDFEDPAKFVSSRVEKRQELESRINLYKKWRKNVHIFETRLMALVIAAVSLYLNIEVAQLFAKFDYLNLPQEKMREVLIRMIPCLICLAISAGGFTSILRRRLDADPRKNLKKPADKQILCFYLVGLVFNVGTMFLCEPVLTKAIKRQINNKDPDAPEPKTYFTTAFLAFFIFYIGFVVTFEVPNEDEFFIGVVRLIMVHIFIWVYFAWVMDANRHSFDGINTFSDALYFSMTVHTTIGYGDYGVLKGSGRNICQLQASIVFYLNIVAVYFLMVNAQEHQTDDDTGEKLKRMPGRNVVRGVSGTIVLVYMMFYLAYKPTKKNGQDRSSTDKGEFGKYGVPTVALYIMMTLILGRSMFIKLVKNKSYKDDMLNLSSSYLFWMIMTQLMCVEESYYAIKNGTYKSFEKTAGKIGTTVPYFTGVTSSLFLLWQIIVCLKNADDSFKDQEYSALAMMMITNMSMLLVYTVLYMHFNTHFGYESTGELKIENFDDALYFSVITHTTVGFGDIAGANDIVARQLVTSHAFATFIIGVASYAAVSPDTKDNEFLLIKNEKQTYWTPFMRYHGGKTTYQVAAEKGISRHELLQGYKVEAGKITDKAMHDAGLV